MLSWGQIQTSSVATPHCQPLGLCFYNTGNLSHEGESVLQGEPAGIRFGNHVVLFRVVVGPGEEGQHQQTLMTSLSANTREFKLTHSQLP